MISIPHPVLCCPKCGTRRVKIGKTITLKYSAYSVTRRYVYCLEKKCPVNSFKTMDKKNFPIQ